MPRPRILLVTIHPCRMPGGGGSVRAHFFARTAAEIGELTLVSLCRATGQTVAEDIRDRCVEVIGGTPAVQSYSPNTADFARSSCSLLATPWQHNWQPFVTNCIQHCGTGEGRATQSFRRRVLTGILSAEQEAFFRLGLLPPWSCLTWFSEYRSVRDLILAASGTQGFDVLWVEDIFSWPFAADLLQRLQPQPRIVIGNTYNIESAVAARIAAATPAGNQQPAQRRIQRQLTMMEADAYSRCDLTFVCSSEDQHGARRLAAGGRFEVVGNGVDLTYFQRSADEIDNHVKNEHPVLLLTGSFGYIPNLQAARMFAADVMPLIRQHVPSAVFRIAGSGAAAAADILRKEKLSLDCVSDPVDIRPCFRAASLFVVPLQAGGGTRLKILEAMAMGVPVVSTTVGAEGLGAVSTEHLMIGDTPEQLSAACVKLLDSPEICQRLTAAAGRWVEDHYDWRGLCGRAREIVERCLA
jgi:glycosyltransferase involved in cell wall biosynthesis